MKLVVKWVIAAVAIFIAGQVVSGFNVVGWEAAFIAAAVFALLNLIIKPILQIFTFPVTIISFGLFLFVINGFMVYLLSAVVSGISVSGMFSAIFASLIISVTTMILNNIIGVNDKKKN